VGKRHNLSNKDRKKKDPPGKGLITRPKKSNGDHEKIKEKPIRPPIQTYVVSQPGVTHGKKEKGVVISRRIGQT